MTPTHSDEVFENLQQFVANHPEFNEAFSSLSRSAEISVFIGEIQGVLKSVDKSVKLLAEPAKKADVEFVFSEAAALELSQTNPNGMGTLGIEVLKLIAADKIKVRVIGKAFNVLTGGYLSIVKKAGPEFMGFLANKGFKSIGKITQLIKSLKA